MRSLVTGCAGFIGSHLTEALLAEGSEVVGVDCFNDNYGRRAKLRNLDRAHEWEAFEFVPIDLSRGDLLDVVADVDTVFHLAAEPGVRPSWSIRFDAYLRNNVLATHHLLDAARNQEVSPRFVYASSSSVYGEAETLPTAEGVIPRPYSPYGVTKLSGEHLCTAYGANFGVPVVTLRYFSVYGPRQRPDMAFTRFCNALIDDEAISVFGDGTQTRDFTYVGDVVAATLSAANAESAVGGTFNVGGGSRVALNDAVDLLGEIGGRPVRVTREELRAGDVRDTGADTSLAQEVLEYRPTTKLAEGLRAQFDWALAERGNGS
jgi:nucleoside-diphosphate-sugar epimerase